MEKLLNFLRNIIIVLSLFCLMPLLVLVCILVYLEDGRPIIFIQPRIGINKVTFNLFKIRSMKKNTAQLETSLVKQSHILIIGKLIRKFKIDELVQLINVLAGQINLVGPRPCLTNQEELINLRDKYGIFNIKPGITGLSQVCGYDMSNPQLLTRVDKIYEQNRDLVMDFKILIATITGVFRSKLSRNVSYELGLIHKNR